MSQYEHHIEGECTESVLEEWEWFVGEGQSGEALFPSTRIIAGAWSNTALVE